ncbi:hypothetical protein LMTR3_21165 [Bradyrhizobium sp. LMTR 3]|nr:hypothetical protein LMTR3_21165 [Bradyrhizobium sp. LMTR 3]
MICRDRFRLHFDGVITTWSPFCEALTKTKISSASLLELSKTAIAMDDHVVLDHVDELRA